MYLDVIPTDEDSRTTPVLKVVFDSGDQVRCETPRDYIWSTETGHASRSLCDRYITLEDLPGITRILVQP
ncbi:hypothetical protein M2389_000986 [Microbacterium phyllosphaerae]|nr:hypothetical protein [Microbacterium phyllosphaerae]